MTNLGFFLAQLEKNMVFQYSDNFLSICFCPEEVCQGTS